MRPAREILRDLAACFQFPTQDARLAALVEEAREFERVADGMTSPPPEPWFNSPPRVLPVTQLISFGSAQRPLSSV